MTYVTLLLVILAIALFPVMLGFLTHGLPLLREHLAEVAAATRRLSRESLSKVGALLTDRGRFTPRQTVAQVAGALVLVGAGIVFALSDLQLTLATLGPIFGIEVDGAIFGRFDHLIGISLVLLAVVFALGLTDLLAWTYTTPFAVIERGRVGAFFLTLSGLFGSLAVGVALAIYRVPILMLNEANAPDVPAAWFWDMPAFILVALALLLLVGVAISFMSLDTFACFVVAASQFLLGLALGVLYIVLRLADLLFELVSAVVAALSNATNPISSGIRAGFAKLGELTGRVPERQANEETEAFEAKETLNSVGEKQESAVESEGTSGGIVRPIPHTDASAKTGQEREP